MELDQAFSALSADERRALLARSKRLNFKNEEVIIEEGQTLNQIYVIASGQVRITHDLNDAISAEFAGPLGTGDFIGEVTFIDGRGASATITADGDVEIITIERNVIEEMLATDQSFAGRLYKSMLLTMCRRLRTTNIRVLIGATRRN
jgi:CRP/FNR family cyclic AMP-dependent transcriptional regulator